MYEIKQELGFEVKDALAALDNLGRKFGTFGQRLETNVLQLHAFNAKADATLSIMQRLATQAGAAASAMAGIRTPSDDILLGRVNRGGQTTGLQGAAAAKQMDDWIAGCQKVGGATRATEEALARLGTTGAKSVQAVTLSWQTFARIAETQALIRGFNMVRNAIEEAYTSFQAFSKQVGEIAAINPERTFSQITDNVRQMSDAFNQPLGRVAEAQYQTISDQFTTQTDVTNILTAANKLAKTGAQDLAASTTLLTGALNAYGESSDKAALRSAEFFETIKLGRLRAGELGTALGRVQGIAHELGVSVEELNASLVSITIGGVKSNEAATQMRGIISSLLKPSEELKKAFRDIGVESGTSAVATYGFQGTLEALWKSIDGNKSAAAKMFPNVRAMAGDFRLAGEGAQRFKEAMAVQSKLDRSSLDKPFEQFIQTDAEKLNKELNKLSNFFTAEFGPKLVAQLNSVVQALGGGSGILGALRVLTTDLVRDIAIGGAFITCLKGVELASLGASRGFTLLDLSVQGNAASMTRYFGTIKGVLGLLAAIEGAKIAGSSLGNWYADKLQAPQQAIQDRATRELDVQKTKADAAVRLAENQATQQFQTLRQFVAKASVAYMQDADNFKARAHDIEKSAQVSFDKVFSSRQKLTQELFAAAETSSKNASNVPDTTAKLLQQIDDRKFKRDVSTGPDPLGEYERRLRGVVDEYQELQGNAKDDREQKLADAAWERVQAYKELVQNQLRLIGGNNNLHQIAQLDNDLDRRKIDSLEQYQKTQEKVAQEAEARAHLAESHNNELEKLRLRIQDELKSTAKDAQGDVGFKDPRQYKQDLAAAERDTATFLDLIQKYGKEDFAKNFLGDPRAFESLKREAERALASSNLKNIEIAPESLANLHGQLRASLAKLRVEVPAIAKLEKLTGESVLQVGVDKVLTDAAAKFSATLAKSVQFGSAVKSREIGRTEYAQGLAAFKPLLQGTNAASGDEYGNATDVLNRMERLSQQTNVTRENVEQLNNLIGRVDWSQVFPSKTTAAEASIALKTMFTALQTMSQYNPVAPSVKEQSEGKDIQQLLEGLQRRQDAEEAVKKSAQDSAAAAGNFALSLQQAASTDLSQLIGQLDSVTGAMSGTPATPGGRFASGGIGTDTIPAMLSKGEFVMNAASTRRFYSQLVAMNAGGTPNYSNQGGVTNIGDVSININESATPQATSREVLQMLRRATRRGMN
jgi:TP901 family phage tail tape measure protein